VLKCDTYAYVTTITFRFHVIREFVHIFDFVSPRYMSVRIIFESCKSKMKAK